MDHNQLVIDGKKGERITLWCLFGNAVLSVFKLIVGVMGNSAAMVADAIHSAADVLATGVVYIGLLISKIPKDENHPYGHGKIEPLMSIFVGLSLLFAVYAIIRGTVTSMLTGNFETPAVIAAAAAVVTIIIKEIMYRITLNIGKKLNSESIIANAWDHRSDAISSVGTFTGITASIIGGYYGIEFLRYMDPVAGFIVACVILKIAVDILVGAFNSLMDKAPEKSVFDEITEAAKNTPGVTKVSDVKARFMGRHIFSETIIEVAREISVEEGHNIAIAVRSNIIKNVKFMEDVLIHVEPEGFSEK